MTFWLSTTLRVFQTGGRRDRYILYEQVRQSVCARAERAAEKLRQDRRFCRLISVWLHSYGQKGYSDSRYLHQIATLRYPVQDTRDIVRTAVSLLDAMWCEHVIYGKSGIMLGAFSESGICQPDLFDNGKPRKNSGKLMSVMDYINRSGTWAIWHCLCQMLICKNCCTIANVFHTIRGWRTMLPADRLRATKLMPGNSFHSVQP